MQQIFPDLWETTVENPAPGLYTHAYLLLREDGNVLFYNTGHQHEIDEMAKLGGVAYQYLSHQDELGESLTLIRQRFGARLGGNVREQAEFARYLQPDILFDQRETHLGNIDVIPTPGHTPGSTCFLVTSKDGKRYLFTGDTLYRNPEGHWKAGFIPGYSDKETLKESLKLLQGFKPDVVICSGFEGGKSYQVMDPADWAGHVQKALERLSE